MRALTSVTAMSTCLVAVPTVISFGTCWNGFIFNFLMGGGSCGKLRSVYCHFLEFFFSMCAHHRKNITRVHRYIIIQNFTNSTMAIFCCLENLTIRSNYYLYFFLITLILSENIMNSILVPGDNLVCFLFDILVYLRSWQWSSLYPGRQPLTHVPLTWWQWVRLSQCPQSLWQPSPYFPSTHSVKSILTYE